MASIILARRRRTTRKKRNRVLPNFACSNWAFCHHKATPTAPHQPHYWHRNLLSPPFVVNAILSRRSQIRFKGDDNSNWVPSHVTKTNYSIASFLSLPVFSQEAKYFQLQHATNAHDDEQENENFLVSNAFRVKIFSQIVCIETGKFSFLSKNILSFCLWLIFRQFFLCHKSLANEPRKKKMSDSIIKSLESSVKPFGKSFLISSFTFMRAKSFEKKTFPNGFTD